MCLTSPSDHEPVYFNRLLAAWSAWNRQPSPACPRKPCRADFVSNSIRQLGQKPPRMASLAKPISTVAVIVVVACESNYVTKG